MATSSPDDVTHQFIPPHDIEEPSALGQVVVIVVDSGRFAPEHSPAFARQDCSYNVYFPVFVKGRGVGGASAERTNDEPFWMFVLDGSDAVAAELVFAREQGGFEHEFVANEANKVLF